MNYRTQYNRSDLKHSADEAELSILMVKSQDGDSQSYRALLVKVSQLMTSFIENSFKRLGLASTGGQEDVLQETLLALHDKRSNYDPEHFFLPWLYAIARYKIIDYLRKHKRLTHLTVPLDEELQCLELIATNDAGFGHDVDILLQSLSEKQRNVLKLIKLEGLSIHEVSIRTGYSPSDVKVTTHRALKCLQHLVREAHESR